MRHAESVGLADLLTQVLGDLAAQKTGALLVLPGSAALEGVITPGVQLAGRLSRALLLSIFDSSSPGHDGALITWTVFECRAALTVASML
jgi:DNA integrity scanning protein DisA with diadenylate cyclase activity